MTIQRQKALKDYFKTNGTTLISALGLAWMIMWQGGRAAYNGVSNFRDTVEVTRVRSLENQKNLSAFKIDQQLANRTTKNTIERIESRITQLNKQ